MLPYTPPSAAEAAETAINADLPAIGGIFDNGRASHLVNEFENFAQKPSVYQPTRNVVGHSVDDLAREFEYAFKHGASKNDLFGDEILLSAARSEVLRPSLSAFLKGDIPDVGSHGSLSAVRGDIPGDFNLSISDKCKLRDRSTILARQVFSDQGSEFADAHVHKLLNSLRIDPEVLPASLDLPSTSTWNDIYGNAHVTSNLSHGVSSSFGINHAVEAAGAAAESRKHQKSLSKKIDGWADDYSRGIEAATDGQSSWASEFLADEKSLKNSWINEFESTAAIGSASKLNVESQDTLSQTRRLAETLKADTSQKFQNSKFLQFLSKMSRGELIMEDNAVKEVKPKIVQWANEFDSLNQNAKQHSLEGNGDTGMNSWAAEFSSKSEDQLQAENISQWAEEFNLRTGTMADDWIEQFEEGVGKDNATDLAAAWEEEYLAELERLHGVEGPESSVGYAMTENNPFLDDFDSFAKGKDLFRRGLLSEAILALEAECQRQPGNNEAWRLLGTVQAEADDDVQAIAALNRAIGANPGDLDALLSLGVSYTNELEQRAATRYLWDWLKKHPSHSNIANAALESHLADSSQEVASIIRAFESAAIESPQDKDVHAALGVLYNLARRYDDAIAAFQAALAVQSQVNICD